MITVLFFAKLREDLGCDRLELSLAGLNDGVGGNEAGERFSFQAVLGLLASALALEVGTEKAPVIQLFLEQLEQGACLCAHNQAMLKPDQLASLMLGGDDELAFFPPVTGG